MKSLMTTRIDVTLEVDRQHGPIVRVTHSGITVAIYLLDETAVVTTKKGQYGIEVTGPWKEVKQAIMKELK